MRSIQELPIIMRTSFTILTLASLSTFAACAVAEADELPTDTALASATVATATPMLGCNLEYEKLDPFTVTPVASFRVPFSQVSSQGAVASDGHYQISASVNPAPTTNLSFVVGITNVQTAKDTSYVVLPPPQLAGAFLFETGARISALTKAGVSYDHIRAYCSYTSAP